MTLTLPSPLDEELSPASAALHLAIGLYVGKKASLGRAASVAGLAIGDFMQELCERRIPLNYGPGGFTARPKGNRRINEAMIVVSDTSPITALLKVNAVDLLKDLFADVVIPEAVAAELLQKHPSLPTWLRIVTVLDHETVLSRLPRIDLGEAEAIQLARELKATLLLIDDEEGRAVASEEGITFIDLLGVVLLARRRALIPSARSLVKSLQTQGGVYLSEKLIESALSTVGE